MECCCDCIDIPQLTSFQMGCNAFLFSTDSHTLLVLQSPFVQLE